MGILLSIGRAAASACLLAAMLALAPPARADSEDAIPGFSKKEEGCDLAFGRIQSLEFRGARSRGYEADDTDYHSERGSVHIRHSGGPCTYRLVIEPEGGTPSLQSARGTLAYTLLAGYGSRAAATDGQLEAQGRLMGQRGNEVVGFRVEIPSGQLRPAGQYSGRLTASLYLDDEGTLTLADTASLPIEVDIWPRVAASIGNQPVAGIRNQRIDLGRLKPGQNVDLRFSVEANAPYAVSLSSAEQWRLKHEFSSVGIPYFLSLDGVALDPDHGSLLIDNGGVASRSHDLSVRIGNMHKGQPAGNYSDRLTVTITAD